MNRADKIIRRWCWAVAVYALAMTALAIWLAPQFMHEMESVPSFRTSDTLICVGLVALAVTGWICFLFCAKEPSTGGMLTIILGILTVPCGVVLIIAGKRIRRAENDARAVRILGTGSEVGVPFDKWLANEKAMSNARSLSTTLIPTI